MKNQKLQKFYYRLRHQYLTTNNIVILIGLFIAASWAWGSIGVIQRNYMLQNEIVGKERELKLTQLETETLRYEQNYYKSDEYKELAIRKRMGLVLPGEKVLILPPNSEQVTEEKSSDQPLIRRSQPTNTEQWVDFLLGKQST